MNKNNPNERNELIEQALQEAVSGGTAIFCDLYCDVCDLCSDPGICMTETR